MDKATRRLRARNKAELTPRNQLSRIGARGLGRKNSIEKFPIERCGYIEPVVGKPPWFGTKCIAVAVTSNPKRCLEHCGCGA
jgi:hypothetical protein